MKHRCLNEVLLCKHSGITLHNSDRRMIFHNAVVVNCGLNGVIVCYLISIITTNTREILL